MASNTIKNGPGNNKAYRPVPKGYKGNWNVPKGTPWKKDSPYNPANQVVSPVPNSPAKIAGAKKAAAAKKAKVDASYKASDAKMMRMAKLANDNAAAKKKASASRSASTSAYGKNTVARQKSASAAKKAKVDASYKASDAKMMRMAKQANANAAAKKKADAARSKSTSAYAKNTVARQRSTKKK